ncbi:hypothetical protein [Actinocatenispora rupis]|uniref:Uncharacterized protein n=1 Tax=Actinocatenispora rupis TaxID=519421 RepID=A0A8J3JAT8_9ACTN|nr:hypothetical protein [Actinocatenispora rupis]GID12613.1 hypothetical protein Aru02nite_35020 [Actinocatenispora rupis]
MTQATGTRGRARGIRRVPVEDDLTRLNGPTTGVVQLPNRLLWQPDVHLDLSDRALLQFLYETVLREAHTGEELETWLDGETLIRLWPDLYLPRAVREQWERKHPELRTPAAA